MDLSTVMPCCSGPKRPHDKVAVSEMKDDFKQCLNSKPSFKVIFLIIVTVAACCSFYMVRGHCSQICYYIS